MTEIPSSSASIPVACKSKSKWRIIKRPRISDPTEMIYEVQEYHRCFFFFEHWQECSLHHDLEQAKLSLCKLKALEGRPKIEIVYEE